MRRPLVWLLAFYIVGVTLYKVGNIPIYMIGIILSAFVFWWLMFPRVSRKIKLLNYGFMIGFPILFLLGYSLMKYQIEPNRMDQVFEEEVQGKLYGTLQMIEDKGNYVVLTLKDNRIELEPFSIQNQSISNQNQQNSIQIQSKIIYQSHKLKVYTSSISNYKIGNILLVSGKIEKFQKASNPGQFDEYQYNKIQKYDYKVKADHIHIVKASYSKYLQSIYEIKSRILKVYERILPKKDAGLISAMILGDTSELDQDVKELYQENGISHILAISGLNVSLIGLTIFHLLRRLRLPNFIASIFSIFILYSFGILTNFSVSTNRAVVMLVVFICSGVVGRTYDILSATSLSALIILIQSPMELFNVGFLLSYSAILGMAMLYPILKSMIPIRNKILDGLLLTLSIQIFSLPILLYFFYEFPLYSVIINLLILPLSSLIVLVALLAGLLGCIFIPIGIFLIGGAHYILDFYEMVCRLGTLLPGRTLLIGRPDPFVIMAYYVVLLIWILINKDTFRKKNIILLSFLGVILVKSRNIYLEVTFLDVGQGDCIFMESPSGVTYLIDGGSSDVKEVGTYRIEPFLKSKGIWKLDYVVMTHLDTDHVSGIKELIMKNKNKSMYEGNIIIKNLILPNILEKDEEYRNIVSEANSRGIRVLYIEEGDRIYDGIITISCLNPEKNALKSDNATSVVLSIVYKEFDLLLTGDLEGEGEKQVSKTLKYQDFDVLKVAHHGSKYSTYSPFLSVIRPEYAIISCGRNNSYGHPHKELLDRLDEVGSEKLITYSTGAITFMTDGVILKYKKFLEN